MYAFSKSYIDKSYLEKSYLAKSYVNKIVFKENEKIVCNENRM